MGEASVSPKSVQVTKIRPALAVPAKVFTAIQGLSGKSAMFSGSKTTDGEPNVAPPSVERLTRIAPWVKVLSVAPSVQRKMPSLKSIPATGSVARKYEPPFTIVRLG